MEYINIYQNVVIAGVWSAFLDTVVTEEDVDLMMDLAKKISDRLEGGNELVFTRYMMEKLARRKNERDNARANA